jgi:hypothetical protein
LFLVNNEVGTCIALVIGGRSGGEVLIVCGSQPRTRDIGRGQQLERSDCNRINVRVG